MFVLLLQQHPQLYDEHEKLQACKHKQKLQARGTSFTSLEATTNWIIPETANT